jgi:hypothetical protein
VRELASEDVDALAGSISLLGQLVPAIVRPAGDGYLLGRAARASPADGRRGCDRDDISALKLGKKTEALYSAR